MKYHYLDQHVRKDAKNHMDVGLRVSKLTRPLYVEGATGSKGEGEGAEDDADQLGLRWSAC